MYRTALYLAIFAVLVLIALGFTQDRPVTPNTQPQGNMMQRCQQMMARHQHMKAEMKAMNEKLGALVKEMNQAKGNRKIDAMAAVINEMVEQRQTILR
ncbi:MAG: hypothetical protein HY646_01700 [Acidobacteria bacterium]|nr:hypothetical protein [Acidobacteriota bacterium]